MERAKSQLPSSQENLRRRSAYLSVVKLLLGSDDVKRLVVLVLVEPLLSSSDITSDVNGGTILLPNNGLTELVGLEVDDESALRVLDDTEVLETLNGVGLRLGRDLRLARVDVEVDVEAGVGLLVLGDREITELAPESERGLVTCGSEGSALSQRGSTRERRSPFSMPTKNSRALSWTAVAAAVATPSDSSAPVSGLTLVPVSDPSLLILT